MIDEQIREIRELAEKQKEELRISHEETLKLLDDKAKAKQKQEIKEGLLFFAKLFALGLATFLVVLVGLAITAWVLLMIVKYVLY